MVDAPSIPVAGPVVVVVLVVEALAPKVNWGVAILLYCQYPFRSFLQHHLLEVSEVKGPFGGIKRNFGNEVEKRPIKL